MIMEKVIMTWDSAQNDPLFYTTDYFYAIYGTLYSLGHSFLRVINKIN